MEIPLNDYLSGSPLKIIGGFFGPSNKVGPGISTQFEHKHGTVAFPLKSFFYTMTPSLFALLYSVTKSRARG